MRQLLALFETRLFGPLAQNSPPDKTFRLRFHSQGYITQERRDSMCSFLFCSILFGVFIGNEVSLQTCRPFLWPLHRAVAFASVPRGPGGFLCQTEALWSREGQARRREDTWLSCRTRAVTSKPSIECSIKFYFELVPFYIDPVKTIRYSETLLKFDQGLSVAKDLYRTQYLYNVQISHI